MRESIEEKNVRQWETIVAIKKGCNINMYGSVLQPKEDNKWLIIGYPCNLQGEMMFYLVEYNEDMNPQTGIFSYVISKEELEENFEIVGKHEMEY